MDQRSLCFLRKAPEVTLRERYYKNRFGFLYGNRRLPSPSSTMIVSSRTACFLIYGKTQLPWNTSVTRIPKEANLFRYLREARVPRQR